MSDHYERLALALRTEAATCLGRVERLEAELAAAREREAKLAASFGSWQVEYEDARRENATLREALRRMVEHTSLDTLTYEQVRELGRAALAGSPAAEEPQP